MSPHYLMIFFSNSLEIGSPAGSIKQFVTIFLKAVFIVPLGPGDSIEKVKTLRTENNRLFRLP